MNPIQQKWDRIYSAENIEPDAAEVLASHRYLLPSAGRALDVACGLGANAILLARHGLEVNAWDISKVATDRLQHTAAQLALNLVAQQYDLSNHSWPKAGYDVIVVSRFLDRTLCDEIMSALKPAGLLFYQTFTRDKPDAIGPNNPDYLLKRNELLRLFAPLHVVYYQEYQGIGDLGRGNRNEACFIGQKLD
ncbi:MULTISPECIES: class I SAM-dependent methyltransferase [Methylomonas]|uniref:class I SAM-dependent methyltransferase n=1 Tax=Methylomonas TaxID=416 RepID=UPI001231BC0F|nr:methyltransferase domain-containing protein [Methylomonas rhizoryzae]